MIDPAVAKDIYQRLGKPDDFKLSQPANWPASSDILMPTNRPIIHLINKEVFKVDKTKNSLKQARDRSKIIIRLFSLSLLVVLLTGCGLDTISTTNSKGSKKMSFIDPMIIEISKDGKGLVNDHGSAALGLSFDGQYLIYEGEEILHRVDLTTGNDQAIPTDPYADSLVFLGRTTNFLAGNGEGFKIIDAQTGQISKQAQINSDKFLFFNVSPDGKLAADGNYELWDLTNAKLVRQFDTKPSALGFSPIFNKDGSQVLVLTSNGAVAPNVPSTVLTFDVASGKQLSEWLVPGTEGAFGDLSPDGSMLALLKNQTVTIWNVASRSIIKQIQVGSTQTGVYYFAANNQRLVLATKTGIELWDIATSKILQSVQVGDSSIGTSFTLSGDTNYMAISDNRYVYVYPLT